MGGGGRRERTPPPPFSGSLSPCLISLHTAVLGLLHTHTHTHRIAAYFDFRKNTASYTLTQAAQLRILLL